MEAFFELTNQYWWVGVILVTLILLISAKRLSKFFGSEAVEITLEEAIVLIEQEQATLIDLAEKKVFEKSHIVGATNMPGITFINATAKLEDTSKPIILLPMKGLFPMPVVQFLYKAGVPKLYLLKGTVNDWKKAGFNVFEM